MNPTKAQLAQQKRNLVQRATDATMHLLHESFMYGTSLWPKKGFKVGWNPEKRDTIMIGARYTDGYGWLIINFKTTSFKRVTEQCKAVELILTDAIYDGILFTYARGGYHNHIWGNAKYYTTEDQLIFDFKDTTTTH